MDLALNTTLRHLTLLTWDVEPEKLQSLLPSGLVPTTVASPKGPRALFSMALMLEAGLAPKSLPWLSLYFAQLNERAYVTRPDGSGPGVFFWRSFVASPSFIFPRLGLGLPYFWQKMSLDVKEGALQFSVKKEKLVELELGTPPTKPEGGPDPEEVREITANPMIGYSLLRGKTLAAFTVEHAPIVPKMVTVREVNASSMLAYPLLSPGQAPVVACYAEEAPFTIHLPPQKL